MARIIKGKNANRPWTVRYWAEDRQREKSFRYRREADTFAATIEVARREGTFVDPRRGSVTFRSYAADWLAGRARIGESTRLAYGYTLANHVCPRLGDLRLSAIRREDVKAVLAEMRSRGLSASTIEKAFVVTNAVLREAVKDKRISSNPAGDIEIAPAREVREFIHATRDQLVLLEQAMPAAWAATIPLMHGCGLRVSEALAVSAGCRRGSVLRVHEQISPGGLSPLKSRAKGDYRDTVLPAYADAAMTRHIDAHGTTDDGHLFAGARSTEVLRATTHRGAFRRAVREAGLPAAYTPHQLRHHFASVALAGGVPLTDLARWLGHGDVNITYRIYGHLLAPSIDRARGVLDAAWTIVTPA